MYEELSAEYVQIYESITIEFSLRLKIHKIGRGVLFERENIFCIVIMVNHEELPMQCHGKTQKYCADQPSIKNNSRFVSKID